MTTYKAMTIAGSDSGGGAGIQADLKTFTCLEVFGTSVITSVTAQNTATVDGIHPIPGLFVQQQMASVLSDIGANAIKTGMLCNAEIIINVGQTLQKFYSAQPGKPIPNFTIDPVMISSTGAQLLETSAIEALITHLLPICHILTPNVPEALKILHEGGKLWNQVVPETIGTIEDMKLVAKALASFGPKIVVLKGGHLPFNMQTKDAAPACVVDDHSVHAETPFEVVDIVYDSESDTFTEFQKQFLRVNNTHGTGCALSAAITAYLARGLKPLDAIQKALRYVHTAIETGFAIGQGSRQPLNHFHAIVPRALNLPSKSHPYPLLDHLLDSCRSDWDNYTKHAFVKGIGDGTLPRECFIHYIIQDYFFLQNYARAYALAAHKAKSLEESKSYADTVIVIAHETKLHKEMCAKWGVSFEQILATPESMANVAYTRYVLDVGATGDILDLNLAMAPCSVGYGEIGTELIKDPKTLKGPENPYWEWIQNYAGEDYQHAMFRSIELIEKMAATVQPSLHRLMELEKIFRMATKLEIAFWDMGMNQA